MCFWSSPTTLIVMTSVSKRDGFSIPVPIPSWDLKNPSGIPDNPIQTWDAGFWSRFRTLVMTYVIFYMTNCFEDINVLEKYLSGEPFWASNLCVGEWVKWITKFFSQMETTQIMVSQIMVVNDKLISLHVVEI